MPASPDVYAQKALSQIPRLLGLQDRNFFSPTYGCFHRDYWLDKTSDFPDAVRQFGAHSLALVYARDFPGNIYRGSAKVRDWAIAALDFWARIQHDDGSFDEFYPYERGWVGPSAFTTFTSVEALNLLAGQMPPEVEQRVRAAVAKAARFIAAGESEEDHLANHHAMACLAVWKAYRLLGEADLLDGFKRLWQGFLTYHHAQEGWSREYDGVDPGYLSATVSFLGKIYQDNRDPEILEVLRQSVACCAYFVYPNGYYAGTLGSRNTLQFYPHGFQILAGELPLAAAVAEKMLEGLGQGALVPPEIISDRYVFYRVPEYLQAYLDHQPRPEDLEPLPYQRPGHFRYLEGARVFAARRGRHWVVANLAKGGVVKVFDAEQGRLLLNDCGLVGSLADGKTATSQWVDPEYKCQADRDGFTVEGSLQEVPSHKLFTLFKNLLFRGALWALGWSPAFSHWLKGAIRRALMLGTRRLPLTFRRSLKLESDSLSLVDEIRLEPGQKLVSLMVGDEFFVRYVPQSRYFQPQELEVEGLRLGQADLERLNAQGRLTVETVLAGARLERRIGLGGEAGFSPAAARSVSADGTKDRGQGRPEPGGVLDMDYARGREKKKSLRYRLWRRTHEIDQAIQRHMPRPPATIVDLGTADGRMMRALAQRIEGARFTGVEYNQELVDFARANSPDLEILQGDIQDLPLADGSFECAIAAAVIEHVPNPGLAMREAHRVLRPGGLLVLTCPDPFWEKIATMVGHLQDEQHDTVMNLRQLGALARESGFTVLETTKFMISPVGCPGEFQLENVVRRLGMGFLLANQLLVARKPARAE